MCGVWSYFQPKKKIPLVGNNLEGILSCPWGRDIVIGIATRYGMDGQGIESRCGARFSAPVQTGTKAHPAFCTMGTGSLSRAVKRSRRGVHDPPHLAPRLKSGGIFLLVLWAVVACSRVNSNFTVLSCLKTLSHHSVRLNWRYPVTR
jgi:hypothetical protein